MTGRVAVLTDSASDLPAEWALRHDIAVVPLTVRIDGTDHLDGVDLDASSFWSRCRASGDLPTTASPSPSAFAAAFDDAATGGADAVVCVTIAASLSSTFQSAAFAAADRPLTPVHVVDSTSASLGESFVARAAAQCAADGVDATLRAAKDAAARVRVWAMVDRPENLQHSGRLDASRGGLGSVLAVKPIVEVRGGHVVPVGRQRTVPRAVDALVELVAGVDAEDVAVVHGDADSAFVDRLVGALASVGHAPSVHLLGPVVGAHLGPGTLAVAVLETAPAT